MRTEVLKKLQEEAEEKYQKFSAKLLPPQIDLLGVRIPKLRQIAKEIAKAGKAEDYLKTPLTELKYQEEFMLYSLLIAQSKSPDKIEQIKKNDLIIKDYRLPGFRGNNTGTKILSAIGYALLIGAVLTSHFSNLKSGSIEEVMMKALYIIGIITFVLLFGNYLGIRRYALLDASKNKALRLIGCFITWLILFLVLIIIFQSFIPKAFLS